MSTLRTVDKRNNNYCHAHPHLITEDVNASIDFYCAGLGFQFILRSLGEGGQGQEHEGILFQPGEEVPLQIG